MGMAKNLLRHFLKSTRYELAEKQKRLPAATFDNVRLVLAWYRVVKPDAVLVQIGANDGTLDDPVGEFIRLGTLKSVLVEPIPAVFAKLTQSYQGVSNVSLVQAAIGDSDGPATLYQVRLERQPDYPGSSGWASFDRAHLIKHHVRPGDIAEARVPSLTLSTLLARHQLNHVDIMQIDVEGFDAEIVQMALKLPSPPACFNFENIHLSLATKEKLFRQLEAQGYAWTHDKYNTLALHRSLTEQLVRPPGRT